MSSPWAGEGRGLQLTRTLLSHIMRVTCTARRPLSTEFDPPSVELEYIVPLMRTLLLIAIPLTTAALIAAPLRGSAQTTRGTAKSVPVVSTAARALPGARADRLGALGIPAAGAQHCKAFSRSATCSRRYYILPVMGIGQ